MSWRVSCVWMGLVGWVGVIEDGRGGRGWWESRVLVGYLRGGWVGGLELGVY